MKKTLKIIGYITGSILLLIIVLGGFLAYDNINSYTVPERITETYIKEKYNLLFQGIDKIITTESENERELAIEQLNKMLLLPPQRVHSVMFNYNSKNKMNSGLAPGYKNGIYKQYSEKLSIFEYGNPKFEKLKGLSTSGKIYDLLKYKINVNKSYLKSIELVFYYDYITNENKANK